MTTTPSKSGDPVKDQLIEAIYRIALEPQSYDAFMGHWDDYISNRIEELAALQSQMDADDQAGRYPEIAKHFDIASQLLEQMDVQSKGDTALAGSLDPQFLLNSGGRVVWLNAAAEREFGLKRDVHFDALALPDAQSSSLRELCDAVRAKAVAPPVVILKITGTTSSKPFYLYARSLPEQSDEDIVLVSKMTPDWPEDMPELLNDAFGLSPSEVDICALIADGHGAAQIAEIRQSSLATVRTQIKRIMAKTSCSTQAELVRLLHSIMRVAENHARDPILRSHAPDRVFHISLEKRLMPVEQFGDPAGRPVLFLHGMLDGNTVSHECQAMLRRSNIRLVCPVRPSFGTADPDPGPIETAPDRMADDVLALMEQLQIPKAPVLGHMAGSRYAFALAAKAPPEKITAIVSVAGGVPITSLSQFSVMSRRQRLVAYTAKFTPSMLPFVLRAGISQIQGGGERKFMRSLYENAPHDEQVIADPEIAAIVMSGYKFTVRQGHRAFEIDSYQVVRDWSATVTASQQPIHVIHGISDPVVNSASVRDFYASLPSRATLKIVEDCGQLVLFKHPDLVVDTLASILDAKD